MPDIITTRTVHVQHRSSPKNVATLLYRFGCTPEFRGHSDETSRQFRRIAKRLAEKFGKLSIAELERPEFRALVYDWRDEMAETPAECEKTIRTLARCVSWGVDRGFVRYNRIEAIRFPWRNSRPRADIVWTPREICAIRPHLGPLAAAFELSLWTGLRQGDVLHATQRCLDGEWLRLVPAKTQSRTALTLHLPYALLAPLRVLLNGLRDPGRELLLPETWHERTFRRLFTRVKIRAGLGERDRHWHDLRGTLATWLFEAGCTQPEAGAILGHAPGERTTRRYAAQSRVYAKHAFRKLDAYMREHLAGFYGAATAAAHAAISRPK